MMEQTVGHSHPLVHLLAFIFGSHSDLTILVVLHTLWRILIDDRRKDTIGYNLDIVDGLFSTEPSVLRHWENVEAMPERRS